MYQRPQSCDEDTKNVQAWTSPLEERQEELTPGVYAKPVLREVAVQCAGTSCAERSECALHDKAVQTDEDTFEHEPWKSLREEVRALPTELYVHVAGSIRRYLGMGIHRALAELYR